MITHLVSDETRPDIQAFNTRIAHTRPHNISAIGVLSTSRDQGHYYFRVNQEGCLEEMAFKEAITSHIN